MALIQFTSIDEKVGIWILCAVYLTRSSIVLLKINYESV